MIKNKITCFKYSITHEGITEYFSFMGKGSIINTIKKLRNDSLLKYGNNIVFKITIMDS